MHIGDPVPQTVHDQGHGAGMNDVQAVARTGEVDVMAGIVRVQPVVNGVVYPGERQRGPELVAFSSVVLHDIEDHLDPGAVQRLHHGLEFSLTC